MRQTLQQLGVARIGDGVMALLEDARTRKQLEWIADHCEEVNGAMGTYSTIALASRVSSHRRSRRMYPPLSIS